MKKELVLKIFGIFTTLFIVFFTYRTFATDLSTSYCTFNNCSPKQITYDNFLKVEIGSNYNDVVKILGKESYMDSAIINGLKNTTYIWKINGTEKNIFITFRNGIVITKEQYKLNDKFSILSNKKINSLKKGMSYNEVKNILGEGILRSEEKETQVYSWFNNDSSYINCTFKNDKLNIFMGQ
ncbi:hypothetical protein Z962_06225 [Clostridium botulinum C/D str. BKT12695]|nr:hypothetical protein Z962_06225 [Clostridium botulinum C/D str. BKT12695]